MGSDAQRINILERSLSSNFVSGDNIVRQIKAVRHDNF